MGVDAGLYMYDVVVKGSRLLSHLLMSSCYRMNQLKVIRWTADWSQGTTFIEIVAESVYCCRCDVELLIHLRGGST